MKYLRELIHELNRKICPHLDGKETYGIHNLVKQVRRGSAQQAELLNVDMLNCPVVIDDKYQTLIYHRLDRISGDKIDGRGRGNNYRLNAQLLMIVCTTSDTLHDLLLFLLMEQANIEYSSSSFDHNRIIQQETGRRELNIDRPLFQINYTLTTMAERCLPDCNHIHQPIQLPGCVSGNCILANTGEPILADP